MKPVRVGVLLLLLAQTSLSWACAAPSETEASGTSVVELPRPAPGAAVPPPRGAPPPPGTAAAPAPADVPGPADRPTVLPSGPIPGHLAPEFILQDADGNEVRLADLRGRAVLLNFWATW